MKNNLKQQSLVSLNHRKPQIDTNREYQRNDVWTTEQKQKLIESIYLGIPLPNIYLEVIDAEKGEKGRLGAIDGKQRLTTIWDFFGSKFKIKGDKVPKKVLGMTYAELGESDDPICQDFFNTFQGYDIGCVFVEDASDDEIADMFKRLQLGSPLNGAEKRRSIGGEMRDCVTEITEKYKIFNFLPFNNKRLKHEELVAKTLCLELAGEPADCAKGNLDKMYKSYADNFKNSVALAKAKQIYGFIDSIFVEQADAQVLDSGYFVSLYLLLSRLWDKYVLKGHEKEICNFIKDIYLGAKEAKKQMQANNMNYDKTFYAIHSNMGNASDKSPAIRARHNIFEQLFIAQIPGLKLKDAKRQFDHDQRLKIYNNNKGICQTCNQYVPWTNFEADHIDPHSLGGQTILKNGQLLCSLCNKKKSNKIEDELFPI